MSVTMASLYVTVHLFGFMTKEVVNTSFKTMPQCVNSLLIKKAKYDKDPSYVVLYSESKQALKISRESNHTIQLHQCNED